MKHNNNRDKKINTGDCSKYAHHSCVMVGGGKLNIIERQPGETGRGRDKCVRYNGESNFLIGDCKIILLI